ncbi:MULTISPECIES: proteasome subunit beta [Thermomonospora]|uniref:Proteasome subunit beta 2 n=1 Tax=Thermomonospora curvata (strain ATCC 19995 / DSM 43183 / JCM 3096 / KCTC 9072 / NBRC 15933 / NCIMB 10081 / Henssen B9) TaxID=471852 RepID=PSB2_THECD|nr:MULTISPECIES: proteasome subunit beta [Thermomonospora]D1A3V2.1 RecName: Full=Proteasome subunit beta 2; AltName: Full=20S proteasome beta subunit 2; AltName: Full=Proteasome core protein PrcB 2; Flags: Precursor [Thermomonospora curvata DSM 43183]ACY98005.1 20S proteasome A and B subunits [Thermomonospora curvata DSM 43183]PKK14283.1 MAG: proteasome subunit beta 2 [Thermomonospora sp. CIF 1]
MTERERGQGLPAEFFAVGTASFVELLSRTAPQLLPVNRVRDGSHPMPDIPHGTTIVAVRYPEGVMLAGDRRATSGNLIAQKDLEKVHRADEHSAVAMAGTVGLALEMIRLLQVELEHYEKLQSAKLSLPGKARRLGAVIRANLAHAMQGLAVVPVFAGYDLDAGVGRIYNYDITGMPQESRDFHAEGSGSPFARGALKKLYRPDLTEAEAAAVCVQALYDAAEDDAATAGPDLARRIFPTIATVTADGYRRLPEQEVAELTESVVGARRQRPDGPVAPLR